MRHRNSPEKRETAKGIPLINHRALWKCIILVKEKVNWKYGLLWWWIDPGEWKEHALRRELREEIWSWYIIKKIKDLVRFETNTQIHNVFALKLWWNFYPARNEIAGFAFYPLEDKYYEERDAIRNNMEEYAKIAVDNFRDEHNWKKYEVSYPTIERKYFDQFHRELDALKKTIQNKK